MSGELFAAIKKGDEAAVDRMLAQEPWLSSAREPGGVSAVLTALYHGRRAIAERILRERPALDVFDAAAAGDTPRLRELLDGDPSLVNSYAADGFHPLGLAAFFRRVDAVRLLLDRGADVAAPARNRLAVTALHSAVATDAAPVDLEIVRMLLDAGAPVNVPHLGGGTPLHSAAFTGDAEVVRTLLDRGADPTLRTDDGKTAIDIARERGHAAVAEMLERARR
jgi:ankyrin repeat protein